MTARVNNSLIRVLVFVMVLGFAAYASAKDNIPDFTKGEELKPGNKRSKNMLRPRLLGPTGLHAVMYADHTKKGATRRTRQFLVTKVESGSPADGKIKVEDVILGVNGKNFERDARKVFAAAIEQAEGADGRLSIHLWRAGDILDVEIPLRRFGVVHSETCPYNCPKCEALIDVLSDQAKKAALSRLFLPSVYALGMLATGREDLMPQVRDYAHDLCVDRKTGKRVEFLVSAQGKRVWRTAYRLIFLAEYYMATGDEYVLPTVQELAVGAARGQSGVGTYGHRFSSRKPDGSYHGRLLGYGAINNAAISMYQGLCLAQKAGVEHEELTRAIAIGKRYFDFWVEHGTISYGDHWAGYDAFDNNGINAQAAILYDFLGDQTGQRFFSAMTVGSGPTGCEFGHQGSYWSHLWGGLGAARSGEEGGHAFFAEKRYIRILERSWTGKIIDQGNIGPVRHSMTRGDVTGERLLLVSLGRKKLCMTGKHMKVETPLNSKALETTIQGGRLIYNPQLRAELSEDGIFTLLASELSPIRMLAAKTLRDQNLKRVDKLISMLDSPDRNVRYGACSGLSQVGFNSSEAVAALIRKLKEDEDILFRYFAVDALAANKGREWGLNGAAGPAVPLLLKLASKPVPDDPRQHLHWWISEALFYYRKNLYRVHADELEIDDALFVGAVEQFLHNENGRARSMVPLEDLTDEQLEPLWPDILQATRHRAPSGIMFSGKVMDRGLKVLAEHRIKEGLDLMLELSVAFLQIPYSKEEARWVPWFAETMLAVLPEYGQHAEPVLDVVEQWPVLKGRGAKLAKKLPALRKKIETSEKVPLKSIK